MTDLFSAALSAEAASSTPEVLSVSQVSFHLKRMVEQEFGRVSIQGEISSLKQPGSGHVYFNLKDSESVINAVVWRSSVPKLRAPLSEGAEVVVRGKITTYAPRSNYQIIIDQVEIAGQGALMQLLEERKQKLAAEGLFDEECKQPLPLLPRKIGIITSPTGAVIEDMLHRIQARCPRDIMLWPVLVQGMGAEAQITAAIQGFNALPVAERPDVLIVARGGGSLEDLMAFNEESVVRAVAASAIPVISGVGHEPDVTLVDFAADVRAPTPSAAAELAVPMRADWLYTLQEKERRMGQIMVQRVANQREKIGWLQRALPDPRLLLSQARLKTEDQAERLQRAMMLHRRTQQERVAHMAQLLASYAPDGPLKRGFTYLVDQDGQPVRSATTQARAVTIHFHDGKRDADLR